MDYLNQGKSPWNFRGFFSLLIGTDFLDLENPKTAKILSPMTL